MVESRRASPDSTFPADLDGEILHAVFPDSVLPGDLVWETPTWIQDATILHAEAVPVLPCEDSSGSPNPTIPDAEDSRGVIPEELIWEILMRLPVKSLMRFKWVCSLWRSIIINPSFARAYRGCFRGLVVKSPPDWLASSTDFHYVSGLLDDDDAGSKVKSPSKIWHHLTVDHGLRGGGCQRRMRSTNVVNGLGLRGGGCERRSTNVVNGLVCFYYGNSSSLYNIATRESLDLPISTHVDPACIYHLGFDPISKLYKLLKICPLYEGYDDDVVLPDFVRNLNCEILTFGFGEGQGCLSWRSIDPAPWEIGFESVCYNGVLYWLELESITDVNYRLIAFHLTQEKFDILPTPPDCAYLSTFGPRLSVMTISSINDSTLIEIFCHYCGDNGGGGGGNGWTTELKFNLPVDPDDCIPIGILPNGKVVIHHDKVSICSPSSDIYLYDPASIYLYDPAKGELEKLVIPIERIKSSSMTYQINKIISGHTSYHEENILSLRCLTAPSPRTSRQL